MPRISVTGHMDLTRASVDPVRQAIVNELGLFSDETITGISCIARGADSLFAEAILERGGALEVILPASNYRSAKVRPENLAQFDILLCAASKVRIMPFENPNRTAYEAANEALVDGCDRLFAVWDGRASEKSGTGTVVAYALSRHIPVNIIWPRGAARMSTIAAPESASPVQD